MTDHDDRKRQFRDDWRRRYIENQQATFYSILCGVFVVALIFALVYLAVRK